MITKFVYDWHVQLITATKPHVDCPVGLATFHVKIPLWCWTELQTHGRIARNAASGRAKTPKRLLEQDGAWLPTSFYKDAIMGDTGERLPPETEACLQELWIAQYESVERAMLLAHAKGATRQTVNRLRTTNHIIEGVMTATLPAWRAVLVLRSLESGADRALVELFSAKVAAALDTAEWFIDKWHIPFYPYDFEDDKYPLETILDTAAARIARVSFGDPTVLNPKRRPDLQLAADCKASKHASPFEHIARWEEQPDSSRLNCLPEDRWYWQDEGWQTYRNMLGMG